MITKSMKTFPTRRTWMKEEVKALPVRLGGCTHHCQSETWPRGGKVEMSAETRRRSQHQRYVARDPEHHRLQRQERLHNV